MPSMFNFSERRYDAVKIILPTVLAVLLFILAFFGLLLPTFQKSLLEKKQEASRELVHSAIHILAHFENRVMSGEMSRQAAHVQAISLIRDLRYGPEGKDYFWINDLGPNMVMHPYRTDLDGKDLSRFLDPEGTPLFVNFVRTAKEKGAGFVPYVWQWKDESGRLEHKLSYVELFAPWDWIVGTGIYLDDVYRDVEDVTRQVYYLVIAILGCVLLLSVYTVWHGMQVAEKRRIAEEELQNHREHLEDLVRLRTSDLEKALSEVKTLSGFLPICASCKKIRDDAGYWQQIEVYIRDRSDAQFSHGICPDCAKRLYPGLMGDK